MREESIQMAVQTEESKLLMESEIERSLEQFRIVEESRKQLELRNAQLESQHKDIVSSLDDARIKIKDLQQKHDAGNDGVGEYGICDLLFDTTVASL